MPKISSATTAPTYTSLRTFQDAINQNTLNIPSYQTELGHLSLVMDPAKFTTANGGTPFTIPTNPGTAPANPVTAATSTRSGTPNPALADLAFTGPEALRLFRAQQEEYLIYKQAKISLRNIIIDTYQFLIHQSQYPSRCMKPPCRQS